jgi:choline dehydrogenase-like flavoprotein
MYVEQAPNPASRVRLGSERDALGMPRLAVDWQATALDHRSFEKVHDALVRAFEAAGLGRLDFGDAPLSLADTVDAAHHIGTTRMANHPGEGVVDRNCKVFGTENLFVASSAVFATGHSAAPTLTIMALARRLGEHLAALAATQN